MNHTRCLERDGYSTVENRGGLPTFPFEGCQVREHRSSRAVAVQTIRRSAQQYVARNAAGPWVRFTGQQAAPDHRFELVRF